jgi:hypothetical protein
MRVAHMDAHDQNEFGDLLRHTGNIEIGPELLREAHVAAIAGLQIAVVRRSIDGQNIERLELAGLCQFLAQLLAGPHQALVLVPARSIHFPLQACIEQFEIEHREFGRIGTRRDCKRQCQQNGDEPCSHDGDP